MAKVSYISVKEFCKYRSVHTGFINELAELEIIHIEMVGKERMIPMHDIAMLEKAQRMAEGLNINAAGISAILKLLDKMQEKENELCRMRNLLAFYGHFDKN